MTAISDFCDRVNDWLNQSYEEPLITSWVRLAEERLNDTLRIADMIQIDVGTILQDRVTLPSDWQELDFVRRIGGGPLHYISRDEMYARNSRRVTETGERYTITGNYLIVGGEVDDVDGKQLEISYYGDVPQLGDITNWVVQRHSGLLLAATLVAGTMYGIEDERIPIFTAYATDTINTLNNNHKVARASGSVLNAPRRKGFG